MNHIVRSEWRGIRTIVTGGLILAMSGCTATPTKSTWAPPPAAVVMPPAGTVSPRAPAPSVEVANRPVAIATVTNVAPKTAISAPVAAPTNPVVVPAHPVATPPVVAVPTPTAATNAPAVPAPDFQTTVAVQTALDRLNLSCNCIDGAWGPRTVAALKAWQADHKLPVTGELDDVARKVLADPLKAFTTHTVTTGEVAALAPVPETWRGKSEVAALPYSTILETLAEKYHAAEALLTRLNPDLAWPNPPPGTVVKVPAGGGRLTKPASRAVVSLVDKTISLYNGDGRLVGLFPCSIAKDASKRPVGELKTARCAKDPVFIFDPVVFTESPEAQTMLSKLVIPPGPNNPVGVAWIGLNLPGYGMHGTPHPEDIGKTESHGCFRLANWNARKCLAAIAVGMPVVVK